MILRTTSVRIERMIGLAFLVVGAVAVVVGLFFEVFVSFGGGGIALAGLWILLSQSGDGTRAKALGSFRKELAGSSRASPMPHGTTAGPGTSAADKEKRDV